MDLTDEPLWAVVPVKAFACAKERLATSLAPEQRINLARAMVEDVLQVLMESDELHQVCIVSDEPQVGEFALRHGAWWLVETEIASAPGLNAAVRGAARVVAGMGASGMLVVQSDLPLLERSDVSRLVAAWRALGGGRRMALAPSADGGTNLLIASPPDAIDFQFGQDSYARHLEQGRRQQCAIGSVRLFGATVDVDSPADLNPVIKAVSEGRCGKRTARVLCELGLANACPEHPAMADQAAAESVCQSSY